MVQVSFDLHDDAWKATVALGETHATGEGVTRREAVAWALRELADKIDQPLDIAAEGRSRATQ